VLSPGRFSMDRPGNHKTEMVQAHQAQMGLKPSRRFTSELPDPNIPESHRVAVILKH